MKNIAVFYASNTGNTKNIANKISTFLEDIKVYDMKVTASEYICDYENIILGISTWQDGQMQKDWQEIWEEFSKINFVNKKVAIFGLGNQKKYKNNFVDAMGTLYKQLIKANATVVGFTPCNDFDFENSKAVVDNNFVGLVLDIENEKEEVINNKIKEWLEQIKNQFK